MLHAENVLQGCFQNLHVILMGNTVESLWKLYPEYVPLIYQRNLLGAIATQ